jgi:hypothetical protein
MTTVPSCGYDYVLSLIKIAYEIIGPPHNLRLHLAHPFPLLIFNVVTSYTICDGKTTSNNFRHEMTNVKLFQLLITGRIVQTK